MMRHDLFACVAVLTVATFPLCAQHKTTAEMKPELKSEVFNILNLDYPGLETVKDLHYAGDDSGAASALLEYYRCRTGISSPEVNPKNVKISETEQKYADDALSHTFFVHTGYQPSFNYGEDIDWRYWPVKDNELRWQLHRHKWFVPMGKAYRVSGDEKYAEEWIREYLDWIVKNPNVRLAPADYDLASENLKGDAENARFAWRPLEVSDRLQNQITQFELFKDAEAFSPEFLTEFLLNYHKHAEHILGNWSKQGNHLLFEAQRMLFAGTFFPEFRDAATWRNCGEEILNREISVQVYDDGGQYELDPHYHLASINIFCKALEMADMNGFRNDFPQSYIDTIEKMIMFYVDICYPDCTNPCFSDAKLTTKREMMKHYRSWSKVFPNNQYIKYLATGGVEGSLPDWLSKGHLNSGFFVFRNSWLPEAVQMVVKAGPKGEWHCQPDNGTFELWYNGKILFQDSGSYVYAGDREVMEWRNWFRSTCHHNTLTLGNKDLETAESKTLLWQPEGDVQTLVTENQSYRNLKHRRSIFFVDNAYFVIVDEATGKFGGTVNLHYQMPRGKVPNDPEDMTFYTDNEGESQMMFRCIGPEGMTRKKEEGWVSTSYMKKSKRMNVSFNVRQDTPGEPIRFITIIYPKNEAGKFPSMTAKFKGGFREDGLQVYVKVGKEKKTLGYTL